MRRVMTFGLACATLLVHASARGQDYKVVIWFDKGRPIETFQYRAYDLRQGQYTPAVEQWLKTVESRYPGYQAYVRGVRLADERGSTDAQKVGSAVVRDLMVTASYYGGVDLDGPFLLTGTGSSGRDGAAAGLTPRYIPLRPLLPSSLPQTRGSRGRSGFSTPSLPPPSSLFPVPMPYPRPHP